MSSGIKKKYKPYKVIAKSGNVDQLYDIACRTYACKLDEKIKGEDYRRLLVLASRGDIQKESLFRILAHTGKVVSGSLHSALPLPEVPNKIYTVSGLVEGDLFQKTWVVFLPNSSGTVSLISSSDSVNYYMHGYSVPRKSEVILAILEEKDLPFDMREWNKSMIQSYFNVKFSGLKTVPVADKLRSSQILGLDLRQKQNLIQIRKINISISPAQKKKIQAEVQKEKAKIVQDTPALQNSLVTPAAAPRYATISYTQNMPASYIVSEGNYLPNLDVEDVPNE